MSFTISLTDYKMLHPDTAEFPTLSQSGMLAALLEKRRRRAIHSARREAKRRARWQAVRAWFGRGWTKVRGADSAREEQVFVAGGARSL